MTRFTLRSLFLLTTLVAVSLFHWTDINSAERRLAKAGQMALAANVRWELQFAEDSSCTVSLDGPSLTVELARAINEADRIRCITIWQARKAAYGPQMNVEVVAGLSKEFSPSWGVVMGKTSNQQWCRKTVVSMAR